MDYRLRYTGTFFQRQVEPAGYRRSPSVYYRVGYYPADYLRPPAFTLPVRLMAFSKNPLRSGVTSYDASRSRRSTSRRSLLRMERLLPAGMLRWDPVFVAWVRWDRRFRVALARVRRLPVARSLARL
jgi:hypothetical protein